nr:hypothetical protein CFP56_30392 [Quercus suber]
MCFWLWGRDRTGSLPGVSPTLQHQQLIHYSRGLEDDSLCTWWPFTAFCYCWRASIILLYLSLFVGCGEAECGSSMRLLPSYLMVF